MKLPDDKLAIGANGGSIFLWETKTFTQIFEIKNAHSTCVNVFALLNDKVTLVSGTDEEKALKMWNIRERSPPITSQKLFGHSRQITSLSVMKDNRLVSGSLGDTIIVWKFEALKSTGNSLGKVLFFKNVSILTVTAYVLEHVLKAGHRI